ncbi:putative manganese transporter, partial [Vibrio fortis]
VSVMSQFVSGKLGIGALIAALISTLGNAAFLFIASDVSTGIAAIALSVIVGSALGKIINLSHVDDLLRPTKL